MITPAWVSSSQASQGTERRRNALPGAALSLTIPLSWSYIASRASGPLRPPAISSSDNPLTAPSEDHLAVPAWQVSNRDTFLTQTGQFADGRSRGGRGDVRSQKPVARCVLHG